MAFFFFFFPWKAQIASNPMGCWSSQRSWKATSSREGDRSHSHTSASSKIGWTRMQKQPKRRCGVSKPCAVSSTTRGTPPRPSLTTSVSCEGHRSRRNAWAWTTQFWFHSTGGGFFPGSSSTELFFSLWCSFEEGVWHWHAPPDHMGQQLYFQVISPLPSFQVF